MQYSLDWFTTLFRKSISESEVCSTEAVMPSLSQLLLTVSSCYVVVWWYLLQPSAEIAERVENISQHFQFALYRNISRSLFAQHRLVFSVMLTSRHVMVCPGHTCSSSSSSLLYLTHVVANTECRPGHSVRMELLANPRFCHQRSAREEPILLAHRHTILSLLCTGWCSRECVVSYASVVISQLTSCACGRKILWRVWRA